MSENYENSLLVFNAQYTLLTAALTGVYHIPKPKYRYRSPAEEEESKFMGLCQDSVVHFVGKTEAINLEYYRDANPERHASPEQQKRIDRCLNLEDELGIKVGPGKDKRYKKNELLFYLAEEISSNKYFYLTNCKKSRFSCRLIPYEYVSPNFIAGQRSAKELAAYLLRRKHL